MKISEILYNNTISNRDKFGIYVRMRRRELNITLRDFARTLNLAPSYISDIENGNRYAPLSYLNNVAKILQIPDEEMNDFYDIAGCTHSNWPDINEYLSDKPIARKAIRLAKNKNLSGDDILNIIKDFSRKKEDNDFIQ